MNVAELKRSQLESLARHREGLRRIPRLRWLFFEITDRCNLNCRHCGSSCTAQGQSLTAEDVGRTLQSVRREVLRDRPDREEARAELPTICLTGGEPLLHPDLFEIAEVIRTMGFDWGMTTNATRIDAEAAERLREAGMATVSVSLDGMEPAHDALRRRKGAWREALCGLENLQKAGFEPQVTTVIHPGNLRDLEPLYALLCEKGIRSWRPINAEPIGRACEAGDLLLSRAQFDYLLSYIREKRFDRNCPMEVTFGCSHYLGIGNERMVRSHYFLCGAGILTASVRSSGDICACLDIENRPELVQGNIRRDDFMQIWQERFQVFRRDRTEDCALCRACPERFLCGGDSAHTWDYGEKRPLLCLQTLS